VIVIILETLYNQLLLYIVKPKWKEEWNDIYVQNNFVKVTKEQAIAITKSDLIVVKVKM